MCETEQVRGWPAAHATCNVRVLSREDEEGRRLAEKKKRGVTASARVAGSGLIIMYEYSITHNLMMYEYSTTTHNDLSSPQYIISWTPSKRFSSHSRRNVKQV